MSRFEDNSIMVGADYRDPAFEPHSGFDFGDARHDRSPSTIPYDRVFSTDHNDTDVAAQENMFPGMNEPWNPSNASGSRLPNMTDQMFDAESMFEDNDDPNMFVDRDDTRAASQSAIVKARLDRVDERYGNLTPPDEANLADGVEKIQNSRKPSQAQTTQKQSMDRTERARNAAMKRHAKGRRRSIRETRNSEIESELSSEEASHKRENYREKNRAAAAKCRAKKKNHVEKIEQDARTLETENAVLKARVRELRNQHAELRDLALQHNTSVATCRCGSLHRYNMSKAAEITSSFSNFANIHSHAVSDPQDDHSCTMASPDSFKIDRSRPVIGDSISNSQGYDTTSNFAFAGIATPQSMQSRNVIDHDERASYLSGYPPNAGRGNTSHVS